jgi:hypothetical protein
MKFNESYIRGNETKLLKADIYTFLQVVLKTASMFTNRTELSARKKERSKRSKISGVLVVSRENYLILYHSPFLVSTVLAYSYILVFKYPHGQL